MIETIRRLTPHTAKDLAGWHVCLDVIGALLDGREIAPREAEWQVRYEQYQEALAHFPLDSSQ